VTITGVRCVLLSAPYATPGDAERELHLPTGYRPAAFVLVETSEGLIGIGESYAGVYAPAALKALVEQLGPELVGLDALDLDDAVERLRVATGYWGRLGLTRGAVGAIEMALWDIAGHARGLPVVELLGGTRHATLPVYASGGNPKPLDALRRECAEVLDAGYRAMKVRINHLDLHAIVDKVALCRDALGADVRLAVDAAQGLERQPWTTEHAIEVARSIEELDLLWIEEPAVTTDLAGYAAIRAATRAPLAGGETMTSLEEAEAFLEAEAVDVLQPDAAVVGGIGAFRAVATAAEEAGIDVAAHAWCGGVGVMANCHAAFASPNCTYLELSNVPNPLRHELLVEPLVLEEGAIATPTAPGLGVRWSDDLETRFPFRPGSQYRILGGSGR
jgi:L-alanine-DL-glutamate epimerase-like enolase superfamily enzyme